LSTFMASTASGIGSPPRMSTPSMSKAKAKSSASSVSPGTRGLMGVSGVSDGEEGVLPSKWDNVSGDPSPLRSVSEAEGLREGELEPRLSSSSEKLGSGS
jgi:hypothetical protein